MRVVILSASFARRISTTDSARTAALVGSKEVRGTEVKGWSRKKKFELVRQAQGSPLTRFAGSG
jgi:hypothetical protein